MKFGWYDYEEEAERRARETLKNAERSVLISAIAVGFSAAVLLVTILLKIL